MGFLRRKDGQRAFDSGDVVSMIGAEAYFQGTLNANGSLRVDGRMEGSITEAHAVIIGSAGKLVGDITCESAAIGGEVKGNICAAKFVELLSTAHVAGDVRTARIVIEEGAFFDGHCNMIKPGDETDSLVVEEESRAEGA